jgi:hypothetical protein
VTNDGFHGWLSKLEFTELAWLWGEVQFLCISPQVNGQFIRMVRPAIAMERSFSRVAFILM